jgi:hypothetical protein
MRRELEKYRGNQFDPKIYDTLVSRPPFSVLFQDSREPRETPKYASAAHFRYRSARLVREIRLLRNGTSR